MTDYGPRTPARQISVMDKPWNDARAEVQRAINELTQLADVVNIVLAESRISEGGGATTVELPGDGSGSSYFTMGA